jgi:hypothetical protein
MRTYYLSCFKDGDAAEPDLTSALGAWETGTRRLLQEKAVDAEDLRTRITEAFEGDEKIDALIVSGHGHSSLSGFMVRDDPVSWPDLALLLRRRVRQPCTFVFYSCNGGYPGVSLALGGAYGVDFVFGSRIVVRASAMTHATMAILDWKETGAVNPSSARTLVDRENQWGAAMSPNTPHTLFLRVMWGERMERHPVEPNRQRPSGSVIRFRGWELWDLDEP